MKHLPPIGDARLNRYARRAADHAANAAIIAKLALEPDTPKLERPKRYIDPADTRTLRGIPAIGRGIAGATPGSTPHLAIDHAT